MPWKFPSLIEVGASARQTFHRFPEALCVSFLWGGLALAKNERWLTSSTPLDHFWWSLFLGFFLACGLTLLLEKRDKGKYFRSRLIVGAAVTLVLGIQWLTATDLTPSQFSNRLFPITVAALLGMTVLPYYEKRPDGYWEHHYQLYLGAVVSAFCAAVLFCGLSFSLWTVQKLWDMRGLQEHYLRIGIVTASVFFPWLLLSLIPKPLPSMSPAHPDRLRMVARYLLIPLLFLYVVILYAYGGKIIVEREWPKGLVGTMVSVFSALGILTWFAIHPVREMKGAIRTFSRSFFWLLLPLIALMICGVWRRVAEYGITESRYELLAYAAWLGGVAIYLLASRKKDVRVLSGSLAVMLVLTAVGPWSSSAVSFRHQLARLDSLLRKNSLLVDGKVRKAPKELVFADQKEISQVMLYLMKTHGGAGLREWFSPEVWSAEIGDPGLDDRVAHLLTSIGLKYVAPWATERENGFYLNGSDNGSATIRVRPIEGFSHWVTLHIGDMGGFRRTFEIGKRKFEVSLDEGRSVLKIEAGGASGTIPLLPVAAELRNKLTSSYGRFDGSRYPLAMTTATFRARAFLNSLNGVGEGRDLRVNSLEIEMFLSLKTPLTAAEK